MCGNVFPHLRVGFFYQCLPNSLVISNTSHASNFKSTTFMIVSLSVKLYHIIPARETCFHLVSNVDQSVHVRLREKRGPLRRIRSRSQRMVAIVFNNCPQGDLKPSAPGGASWHELCTLDRCQSFNLIRSHRWEHSPCNNKRCTVHHLRQFFDLAFPSSNPTHRYNVARMIEECNHEISTQSSPCTIRWIDRMIDGRSVLHPHTHA